MILRTFATVSTAILLLTAAAVAEQPAVRLNYPRPVQATTTFEFRFDEAMVPGSRVGQPAEKPPVIFRPAVKGRFTWLSQRSGVFTPEEPLALSTTYVATLNPDLTDADGKKLDLDFRETVQTPPMEMKGWNSTMYQNANDAPAEPKYSLLFNVDIDAEQAAPFLKYVNGQGEEVAARVERAVLQRRNQYFPGWRSNDRTVQTWAEAFKSKNVADDLSARAAPRANQLWVEPAHPLAAGSGWRLVVKAGLPARGDGIRLLEPVEVKIGTIRPFEVISAEASNVIGSGRRLHLNFSKNLAKEVTPENLSQWITVEPPPANLKTSASSRNVEITGDFDLHRDYTVTVQPNLPSAESFVLNEPFTKRVSFKQIPPRLYFDEFITDQLSTGSRAFHLLAVNVPKIRVSAKVFPPDAAPEAMKAYEAYYEFRQNQRHRNYEEPFSKIDPADIPGRLVWQKDIDGSSAADEQKDLQLDWNEILGAGQTGVVLVTAEQVDEPANRAALPGTQAIVQVTDLGLVWKESEAEAFFHVFSLAKGGAVEGARVEVLGAKNESLGAATADASGIARLRLGPEARWVLIENGGDHHLVDLQDDRSRLSLRHFHLRDARTEDEEETGASGREQVLLFTDRPVYKPGETVHLKGIARVWGEGRPRIPAGAKATLRAIDPRSRRFLNKELTFSDTGSFSEDISLPQGARGTYRVELVLAGADPKAEPAIQHEFQVQDYQPNAFEIQIAHRPEAIGNTEIELPIAAKYYMGKPLSQARLTWSLSAEDAGFQPEGSDAFDFCQAIGDARLSEALDRPAHFSQEGRTDLDTGGSAKIAVTIPLNPKAPQPRSARLLCEITDLNEQTVSQSSEFTIHSSDYYLGVREFGETIRAGEALPLQVIAVRTDGSPMPEPVEATARLTRIDWQTNRIEAAGNASEYRNEPRFEFVAETPVRTCAVAKEKGKWTVAPAPKGAPLVADKPGQYLLELRSKDAAGREVLTVKSLSVYGEGETAWNYDNQYQIELVPDKEEYASGETAKILIKTPIAGEALVTVEREKVLRSFIIRLSGNAPVVEIPIEAGDAPNVFVSVMLLRGAAESPKKFKAPEYRVGYCELKVTRPEAKLSVYVEPGSPSYRPGEQVSIRAQVLDAAGKPVENAEVTLYAVDEGVLSLMGYETPHPLSFFNAERALQVNTRLTLPALLPEDPEEQRFANKGYLVGGGGEGSDAMRKNFIACAFWNGNLRTTADGRITAQFAAPDSLTRYRVIAVVQNARDQFGSGQSAFAVNKPVMIEPALPRFANVGDRIVVRGVLHNLTAEDGEVEVALELDATAACKENTRRTVNLPAHGSLAVDFPVEFTNAGEAKWKWTARFKAAGGLAWQDAVQSTLKVGYPVPVMRELRIGHTDAAEAELLGDVNPALLEGTGAITVSLTHSRILELRESVEQLLHYPYGCVEQTTSSTLPWVSMRGFRNVLPSLKRTDQEVTGAVNKGIDRLLSMQTSSGGLAYWPGETEPLFWGSAYGGFGLATMRNAGFDVPEAAFARLCGYLSKQLRGTGDEGFDGHYGRGGPSDRCLALYTLALAGKPEPAYHELLFKKRDHLSAENRALLALAIIESHGPAEMAETLLDPRQERIVPDEDAFWSASRESAMRLLAWVRHQPDAQAIDGLASELLGGRSGGHWRTTQGNCWSLLALAEYFAHAEKPDDAISGTLSSGDRKEEFSVSAKAPMQVVEFPLKGDGAVVPLRLANPLKKRVFTEVEIAARPRVFAQPRQDQGYAISRRYAKVGDDGKLTELTDARVGDRVLVTLDIDVRQPAQYVVVDDPLPAIFEAINPAFKSQETRAGEALGRAWVSNYSELREDRALFFADRIFAGQYTIRYLARVRAAGTATAPAVKIEEMYHPERFGMSGTEQLTSLPLK